MANPGLCFRLFQQYFYIQIGDFGEIRTWIVGVEGEQPDHRHSPDKELFTY